MVLPLDEDVPLLNVLTCALVLAVVVPEVDLDSLPELGMALEARDRVSLRACSISKASPSAPTTTTNASASASTWLAGVPRRRRRCPVVADRALGHLDERASREAREHLGHRIHLAVGGLGLDHRQSKLWVV